MDFDYEPLKKPLKALEFSSVTAVGTLITMYVNFYIFWFIGPPFPPVGCDGENVGTTSITLTWRMGLFGDNGRPITSFSIEKYDLKRAYWEIAKARKYFFKKISYYL